LIDFAKPNWLSGFSEFVDRDQELQVVGRHFSTSFWLTMDEERYIFRIDRGKVGDIIHRPSLADTAVFGFRGPIEDWLKFFSLEPPPLYNDPFAMLMRVASFKAEGDTLVFAQNARAFHRFMKLLGTFGGSL
jgi:hypothetical protein